MDKGSARPSFQGDYLEEAAMTLRGISAMLTTILNELEAQTLQSQAIEGVILLADAKSDQFQHLAEVKHTAS